jgi:hypothetical protein
MNNLKTYLTEAYAIDNKSILRILTQNKQINTSDPDYSYYEKLASWANSGGKQQKLKNIDLSTIKLSAKGLLEKHKLTTRYTTLGHLLLALKNLMDQEGKYTPSNELSRLIQQTTLDILASLSGIKNDKKPLDEPDDVEDAEANVEDEPEDANTENDEELRKGIDWTAEKAKRLAKASATNPASAILEKFYNDYYSIEYAGVGSPEKDTKGIVAKLKSLDKILIPEFNALGYNPEVNPLAQFLKILIELKDKHNNIFDKLNTNTYGAIHNSFINTKITGNMLGNYDGLNILFCSDLYSHRGLDIVEYISLWKEVYNKVKGDDVAKRIWAAKIVLNQPRAIGKTYDEKANSLKELQPDAVITPGASEAKLRSMSEIRELYRYIFKAEIAKEKNSKTLLKKEVNPEAVIDILNEAIKQNVVLDMIKLILEQKAYKDKYSENARKVTDWLEKRNYTRSQANINDSNNILQEYALTVKILNTIINALKNHVDKSAEKKS